MVVLVVLRVAAGLIKDWPLDPLPDPAVQGQGDRRSGQGQGRGGVLGQAIVRGKVGIEGDRAVVQQPAAECPAGVGIGAPVFQVAMPWTRRPGG